MSDPHSEPSGKALLALDDDALLAQCAMDTYRSSGPGGQKRNKTSSAVRLRHLPSGLAATAVEDRSQHVNKDRAIRRLRKMIALHVREAIDPSAYQPGEVLRSYLSRDGNLAVNERNPEYPLVVAEVLDVLAASGHRVSEAAKLLGLSTAHLVKFLENDPNLWDRVNQLRKAAGIKTLR